MLNLSNIRTKEFRNLLTNLVKVDNKVNEVRNLMQPKYDAILEETLNIDFNGKNVIDNERRANTVITWSNQYLLNDEVSNVIYSKMDVVIKESGFELESGVCPVLVEESNLVDAYKAIVEYLGNLDATFKDIYLHYNAYKSFEESTLKFARTLNK